MLKPFELFDTIKAEFNLKNDAELARQLKFAPPQISKVRAGVIPCTDTVILRVHETFGLTVQEIRELAARSVPRREDATAGAQ
jgi:plasmid maintenance system antidote protein VapI